MATSTQPRHIDFGTPLDEWIAMVPKELDRDAVGLWQITPAFSDGFGLSGIELECAVRRAIEGLLLRGAVPIVSPYLSSAQVVREDLAIPEAGAIDRIINYWKSLDHRPTFEDIWFALPVKI